VGGAATAGRALAVELHREWTRVFADGDFHTERRGVGPRAGILVRRGDFEAELVFEIRDEIATSDVAIWGEAGSRALREARLAAARDVTRWRRVGGALGVLLFAGLGWSAVGVSNPMFVLGGLLMAVVLLVAVGGCVLSGAWIAERRGRVRVAEAMRAAALDVELQEALRRFRGFARLAAARRAAVVRAGRRSPFRREAALPAEADLGATSSSS
jgi:hypothetical protein